MGSSIRESGISTMGARVSISYRYFVGMHPRPRQNNTLRSWDAWLTKASIRNLPASCKQKGPVLPGPFYLPFVVIKTFEIPGEGIIFETSFVGAGSSIKVAPPTKVFSHVCPLVSTRGFFYTWGTGVPKLTTRSVAVCAGDMVTEMATVLLTVTSPTVGSGSV